MKNVKIPEPLFRQAIDVLNRIDTSDFDYVFQSDFDSVLFAFLKKQQSLELREAYAHIIYAEDEDARFNARIQYLKQRRVVDSSDF